MGRKTGRFYRIKNNKEAKTSDWLGSSTLFEVRQYREISIEPRAALVLGN